MTPLDDAYSALRRVTPLNGDCGRLCGGRCCKGDEDTGMELLPGEAERLRDVTGFTVRDTADGRQILICSGSCDRRTRPIACRIYPLFPLVTEQDGELRLDVIYDPRGKSCPLCAEKARLRRDFVMAVRRAGRCLMRDPAALLWLRETSDLLLDLLDLERRCGGDKFGMK